MSPRHPGASLPVGKENTRLFEVGPEAIVKLNCLHSFTFYLKIIFWTVEFFLRLQVKFRIQTRKPSILPYFSMFFLYFFFKNGVELQMDPQQQEAD